MTFYIVAVGSNIEPEKNIPQAFERLKSIASQLKMASLLQTKPVGYSNQADFINTAFSFHCALSPTALKQALRSIEAKLGRIRTENKNGPRTIDLDIVRVDNTIVDSDYHHYYFVKQSVDELVRHNEKQ
ncbi:2-amino-4-hydroxy-6-hydroxymethyldihydropteridine diphosphokinase [Colwelliaceae bacterium MEBiC 14330]